MNECNKRRGTDVINSALESSKANNNAYNVMVSLFTLGRLADRSCTYDISLDDLEHVNPEENAKDIDVVRHSESVEDSQEKTYRK